MRSAILMGNTKLLASSSSSPKLAEKLLKVLQVIRYLSIGAPRQSSSAGLSQETGTNTMLKDVSEETEIFPFFGGSGSANDLRQNTQDTTS